MHVTASSKRRAGKNAVLALALALVLIATAALSGGAAYAAESHEPIDRSKLCSLTVEPSGEEFAEDLAENASVVLDLYFIAGITDTGDDGYDYAFSTAPYDTLSFEAEDRDAESWAAFAQEVAGIALGEEGAPVVTGAKAGEKIENLTAGLYLVIARSEELEEKEDYVKPWPLSELKEDESIATIANSAKYEYSFAPQLISLPSKEADEDGVINTANPGEWIYDLTATLKPERTERYGHLKIVKTLTEYVEFEDNIDSSIVKDPAIFVFKVEATLGEGEDAETVYSNVVSLIFEEATTKFALLDRIPVGATVTVTEVYPIAGKPSAYHMTQSGMSEDPLVILPDEEDADGNLDLDKVATATFTNAHEDTDLGGHGIVNKFSLAEGEDGKPSKWNMDNTGDNEYGAKEAAADEA